MTCRARDISTASIGLAQTLHNTGTCVAQIGHIVVELEPQLLGAEGAKKSDLVDMQCLQALDYIKQTADDISGLLRRLSKAVSAEVVVNRDDTIDPMTLQELRDVIGQCEDRTEANLKPDKGIELF